MLHTPAFARWEDVGNWTRASRVPPFSGCGTFDGRFWSRDRVREVASWVWNSEHAAYSGGGSAYITTRSQHLSQLRDQSVVIVGDSTSKEFYRALLDLYVEPPRANDTEVRVVSLGPSTNGTFKTRYLPGLNASLVFIKSNFLTHSSAQSLMRAPRACPVCVLVQAVVHVLRATLVVVNAGSWFNRNKLPNSQPYEMYEQALRLFWESVARGGAGGATWYWRTTNAGHFHEGKCLDRSPAKDPAIDHALSAHYLQINRIAVHVLRAAGSAVQLHVLDSATMLYQRGDAHCGKKSGAAGGKVYYDCLHYCWPGPWRDVLYVWLRDVEGQLRPGSVMLLPDVLRHINRTVDGSESTF